MKIPPSSVKRHEALSDSSSATVQGTLDPANPVFNQLMQLLSQPTSAPLETAQVTPVAEGMDSTTIEETTPSAGITRELMSAAKLPEVAPPTAFKPLDMMAEVNNGDSGNSLLPLINSLETMPKDQQLSFNSKLLDSVLAQAKEPTSTLPSDDLLANKPTAHTTEYDAEQSKQKVLSPAQNTVQAPILSIEKRYFEEKSTEKDHLSLPVDLVLRNDFSTSSKNNDNDIDKLLRAKQDHFALEQPAQAMLNRSPASATAPVETLLSPEQANKMDQLLPLTHPDWHVDKKLFIDQENKLNNLFDQIGQLINRETSAGTVEVPLSQSTSSQQVPSTLPHLDDIKLDLSTISTANLQVYNAKIRISPPELGDVIAKLKLNKNNAELTIIAPNHHVKSIVEANIGQLKQHFQAAHLNLIQVEIKNMQADGQSAGNPFHYREPLPKQEAPDKNSSNKTVASTTTERHSENLVDTYA